MEKYSAFVPDDDKIHLLPLYIDRTQEETIDVGQSFEVIADHFAFVCCCRGRVCIECDKRTVQLDEGHVFMTSKGQKYHYSTPKFPCKLKVIVYDGNGVMPILSYIRSETVAETGPFSDAKASGAVIDKTEIFSLDVDRFEYDFKNISFNVQMHYGYRASLYFQQLLYDLLYSAEMKKGGKSMEILNRYILENYCSSIDIQTLAEVYGTSVSYLCREFRQRFGISPIAYVNQLRVAKARKMLVTGRKKVSEIALECGFINTEYFCYVFKKHEHCTPLQYRKNKGMFLEEKRVYSPLQQEQNLSK